MRFFQWSHDGGKDSGVKGFFIVEIKGLFSIVVLKFSPGTREAFHNHAFNALTWWLKGDVVEEKIIFGNQHIHKEFKPSLKHKFTPRSNLHRIKAGDNGAWAISFRGPWTKQWNEVKNGELLTLENGRTIVKTEKF